MRSSGVFHQITWISGTALLATSLLLAQGQSSAPPSTTPGNHGPGPTKPTTPTQPTQPRLPSQPSPPGRYPGQQPTMRPGEQTPFPQMRQPVFLQGKVVFSDGTPAPPSVIIERVCNGRRIPEAYTDTKGHFNFQVGHNRGMIASADYSFAGPDWAPGGMGNSQELNLAGCELRASLAGYRSSTIELTGHRPLDNPDVGTIVLTPRAHVQGFTISMTSLQAPKKAKKAYRKGMKEASKRKFSKARKQLEKAVRIYPQYAVAWYALGEVYEFQKQPEEARKAYRKALGADKKFASPWLKLARLDAYQRKWQDSLEATNQVLKLNPYDFPDAYFYNSLANLNLRHIDDAAHSAREAIKRHVDRHYPQVEYVLGIVLAIQGQYKEAAGHVRRYLQLAPQASNAAAARQQLARLEQALGKQTSAARK